MSEGQSAASVAAHPPPSPPKKIDNQLPLWLFKNSEKFLLSLRRVVLFVLFSLCCHHCKLVCDPAWPQQEVSCEPACFLLRIPLPGQKNRRYGLSHGVLALLIVVAAASRKWTIQWKWKFKKENKKDAHSYRSFLKLQERIWLELNHYFGIFFYLSVPCSLLVISLHATDPWLCLERHFADISCQTRVLCRGWQTLWKSDHVDLCVGEVSKIGEKEKEWEQTEIYSFWSKNIFFHSNTFWQNAQKVLVSFQYRKKSVLQPSKLPWSGTAVL